MPSRFAAAIAITAWIGIAIHFEALLDAGNSIPATVWALAGYFTILTNLLVAVVFTPLGLRSGEPRWPRLIAGVMLSIALVGIVYALLLSGLTELTGGSAIANVMLHRVTPVAVPVYWLLVVPKGRLRWTAPFLWTIFPLAYLAYALVRGGISGRYAYPFIDVAANGWPTVIVTCAIIAAGFVAAGFLVVLIDRLLGPKRPVPIPLWGRRQKQ